MITTLDAIRLGLSVGNALGCLLGSVFATVSNMAGSLSSELGFYFHDREGKRRSYALLCMCRSRWAAAGPTTRGTFPRRRARRPCAGTGTTIIAV